MLHGSWLFTRAYCLVVIRDRLTRGYSLELVASCLLTISCWLVFRVIHDRVEWWLLTRAYHPRGARHLMVSGLMVRYLMFSGLMRIVQGELVI